MDSLKTACDEKLQQTKLSSVQMLPITAPQKNPDNKNTAPLPNSSQVNNNSFSKRDIIQVTTPDENRKKKLKSTLKISKTDISNHINTLKSFLSSQNKNSDSSPSDFALNGLPKVTVERLPSFENVFAPREKEGEVSGDVDKTSTHFVNVNLCLEANEAFDISKSSHKRHSSESSISAEKLDENTAKRPVLEMNEQNGDLWSRGVHPSGLFEVIFIVFFCYFLYFKKNFKVE